MRPYAQVKPVFYRRGSGKALRGKPLGQALAPYLFAAPDGNMIGLFYVTLAAISGDLGWPVEQVDKALAEVEAVGIAKYDREAELLFMPEAARIQMGLKDGPDGHKIGAKDKRRKKVLDLLREFGEHPFVSEFRELYLGKADHGMPHRRGIDGASPDGNHGEMGHTEDENNDGMPPARARSVPVAVPVPEGGAGERPPVVAPEPEPAPTDVTPDTKPATPDEEALVAHIRSRPELASVRWPLAIVREHTPKIATLEADLDALKRSVDEAAAQVRKVQATDGTVDAARVSGMLDAKLRFTKERELKERARRRVDRERNGDLEWAESGSQETMSLDDAKALLNAPRSA